MGGNDLAPLSPLHNPLKSPSHSLLPPHSNYIINSRWRFYKFSLKSTNFLSWLWWYYPHSLVQCFLSLVYKIAHVCIILFLNFLCYYYWCEWKLSSMHTHKVTNPHFFLEPSLLMPCLLAEVWTGCCLHWLLTFALGFSYTITLGIALLSPNVFIYLKINIYVASFSAF